jgi:hypothetical protein
MKGCSRWRTGSRSAGWAGWTKYRRSSSHSEGLKNTMWPRPRLAVHLVAVPSARLPWHRRNSDDKASRLDDEQFPGCLPRWTATRVPACEKRSSCGRWPGLLT